MNFLDHKSIFQSPLFARFQQKIPYRGKTFLIGAEDEGGKISALSIRMQLRKWNWMWIPFGPTAEGAPSEKTIQQFCDSLAKIAHDEKSIFVRVEPGAHTPPSLAEVVKDNFNTKKSPARYSPDHTLVLDLSQSNEELLKGMKPKCRYNLKLAAKKGVYTIVFSEFERIPEKDFTAWYEIVRETGDRDGFQTHGIFYYKTLLQELGRTGGVSLILAYNSNNDVIGGNIVTFLDGVAMYFYGASNYESRALMAPYAIQWESIQEARRKGCSYYDFLGVSPQGDTKHAWAGVTEFKEKFGGVRYSYPPAFDLVLRPWLYTLYKLKLDLDNILRRH